MRPPMLKIRVNEPHGRIRLLEFNMKCPHCRKEVVLAHDLILKRPSVEEEKDYFTETPKIIGGEMEKEEERRRKLKEYREKLRKKHSL